MNIAATEFQGRAGNNVGEAEEGQGRSVTGVRNLNARVLVLVIKKGGERDWVRGWGKHDHVGKRGTGEMMVPKRKEPSL